MKEPLKTTLRTTKKELRKGSNYPSNQPPAKKQNRKGDIPIRLHLTPELPLDFGCSKSWICKNSACRAVLSMDDSFCKRCSCCICHLFDDNKDPSLWLACSSECGSEDSCGLSCHIECALQLEKVGVVDLGQLMQLDGSYCCASCGKVSGIIRNVKKQLLIAKDARRVDVLCYRIYLSFRLLDGTSHFKELHKIIKDAMAKLETEVGSVDGMSVKMARGIVSRLTIAGEVQELCSLAIEKADEWLTSLSNGNPKQRAAGDSFPAACKFLFEEVTSSSVTIILLELSPESTNDVKGYKLWYHKSGEETRGEEPACNFPREQRRIRISNLQPCTDYTFRVLSYMENAVLGHSEAKCFTKSIEFVRRDPKLPRSSNPECGRKTSADSSGFRVRDLGKVLNVAWAQEQGHLEAECYELTKVHPENISRDQLPLTLPDLNEEFTPPLESSRDEDNGCTLERATGTEDDTASHEAGKHILAGSCDSTLINGSLFNHSDSSGLLDENFECCVKIIRWLECEGHIDQEFRLKLLTWFSLRSNELERRVVNTFIQTMIDDPVSLAGQLVDSFSDIVSSKCGRNGLC